MKFSRYLRNYVKRGVKALKSRRFRSSESGFTLTEILVSVIIAGIIMSGLMTVMVELLTSDARETARTETQQEMQMALDYISADIREAAYVYDGKCLDGSLRVEARENPNVCGQGLFNRINVPENTVPILAFWKLEPIPEQVLRNDCNFNQPLPIGIPCVAGRSYSLVIYYLTSNNADEGSVGPWAGMGRIRRAVYRQFPGDVQDTNYINPMEVGFDAWPGGGGTPNIPTPITLVDFVDDRNLSTIANEQDVQSMDVDCPDDYNLTPSDATLERYSFPEVRNFYACVLDETGRRAQQQQSSSDDPTAFNQKVILFIRGNAAGKPGIRSANEGFMPAIQTQVLNRSVRRKSPRQF
ncbi:prepilin-type N-terminal cleavage/methylation domain-containing protein [Sodalinema gerasimenkoae]|uniref:prepilin-type N-terminal cleavage/methylation domain-containing protein n=1 Tax=Sodalinema gerasimenkoae TaxID=2862348 RepID=UPI0024843C0C|nr:prepilin-type N-terminal cleavage/methylation domain-containing protein [Sodalinema gerasimenkoae]